MDSNIDNAPNTLNSMDTTQKPKWCVPPSANNYAAKVLRGSPTVSESYATYQKQNDSNIEAIKSKLAVENWADDEDFDDDSSFATKQPERPPPAPQPKTLQKMSFSGTSSYYELESQGKPQKFDQFKENKRLGVWDPERMCEFSEDLYTTPIPTGLTKEQRDWARRKEQEINMSETISVHHRAERVDFTPGGGEDEEVLYSSVTSVKSQSTSNPTRPNVYVPPSKRAPDAKPDFPPAKPVRQPPASDANLKTASNQKPRENVKVPSLDISKAKEVSKEMLADDKTEKLTKLNPNAVAFCPAGAPPAASDEPEKVEAVTKSVGAMRLSGGSATTETPTPPLEGVRRSEALVSAITVNLYQRARQSKSAELHSEKLNKPTPVERPLEAPQPDLAHPMRLRPKVAANPKSPHSAPLNGRKTPEELHVQDRRPSMGLPGYSPRGSVQMVSISPRARPSLEKPVHMRLSSGEEAAQPMSVPAAAVHIPPFQSMAPQPIVVRAADVAVPARGSRTPPVYADASPNYQREVPEDDHVTTNARPVPQQALAQSPYSPEPRPTMQYVPDAPLEGDSPIRLEQRHPELRGHAYQRTEHPVHTLGFAPQGVPLPHLMRAGAASVGYTGPQRTPTAPIKPEKPKIVFDPETNSMVVSSAPSESNVEVEVSMSWLTGEIAPQTYIPPMPENIAYEENYIVTENIAMQGETAPISTPKDERSLGKENVKEDLKDFSRPNVPRGPKPGKPRKPFDKKGPNGSPTVPRADVGKPGRFGRYPSKFDDGEGLKGNGRGEFVEGKRRPKGPRGPAKDDDAAQDAPKSGEGKFRGKGKLPA